LSQTRPRTERWIVARHVDRVLGLVVQPAYEPDLPSDQYQAALDHAVRGLMAIASPHAGQTERDGWGEALGAATSTADLLDLMRCLYATLHRSGLLRPSPLEEDEV
jgi:hypothetical protein